MGADYQSNPTECQEREAALSHMMKEATLNWAEVQPEVLLR